MTEHQQRGRADQLLGLLGALPRYRHHEVVAALGLHLGTRVTGAVDPEGDDALRRVHVGAVRLPAVEGGRLHRHLRAIGQVKAEVDLEVLVPRGGVEQVSAHDAQEHDHNERAEYRERPPWMRAALRWRCHFVLRLPVRFGQNTSLSDLALVPLALARSVRSSSMTSSCASLVSLSADVASSVSY